MRTTVRTGEKRDEVVETKVRKRRRTFVVGACAALWAFSVSIPLGLFSASHHAALPVARESVSERTGAGDRSWSMVHVLSEECACSRSVLDYLLERGCSDPGSEEVVLLDGAASTLERLRSAGFLASTASSEDFCASFGSEGVPFFQVVNGQEQPAYSGAYFDTAFRATSRFLDLETLARLRSGGVAPSRPVFGCPTSERLKSILDPFGFKQARRISL